MSGGSKVNKVEGAPLQSPAGGGETKDVAGRSKQDVPAPASVEKPAIANQPEQSQTKTEAQQVVPYSLRELTAQETMAETSVAMAIAAFLTFAVTSIGTWLIWRQVALTRKAVEDTSEATEAMREANDIARDSAQRQLRAYVSAQNTVAKFKNSLSPDQVEVAFELRNGGQTPAYDLRMVSRVEFTDDATRQGIFFRGKSLEAPACNVVGPSGSVYQSSSFSIPTEFRQKIFQGKATFVLGVAVSYRDAFGRRRLLTHRAHFDFEARGNGGSYSLRISARGNRSN